MSTTKMISANNAFALAKVMNEDDKLVHVGKSGYVKKYQTERTNRHKNAISQLQSTAEEVAAEGEGLDPLDLQTALRSGQKAIEDIEIQGKEIRKCIDVLKDMALRNVKETDEWIEIDGELNKMKEEE